MDYEYAIQVANLKKSYHAVLAVNGLSFQVPRGSIFGLLGPNGAGKTTTLECIEGLMQQDSGHVSVLGIDPSNHGGELYRVIGVQLQTSGIAGMMTPRDALRLFSLYHRVRPNMESLKRFGLEEIQHQPYEALSVGQKRRLSLAIAAAHDPEILFLDEPTAGLDVESRLELHRFIGEMKEEGKTVVLATHDMAEAEKLCDEIAIMIRGSIAVQGTPSQVTSAGDKRTRIIVSTARGEMVKRKPALAGAELLSADSQYCRYLTFDPETSISALLKCIKENRDELVDLRVERPSLEERFIEITHTKEKTA